MSPMMGMWVGIDLGTTNSTVAAIDDKGKAVVVTNDSGNQYMPSVICFTDDGETIVGNEAKKMMDHGVGRCISAFKYGIGSNDKLISVNGRDYTPEDLSEIMIKGLIENAKKNTGVQDITHAVVTVPAYFDDNQRKSTVRAAQRNGLNVMRVVNEPTSAAIYYGYRNNKNRTILVYDLGGGTFDVTFIKIENGILDVIASGGNSRLGGLDWDGVITEKMIKKFEVEHKFNPRKDPIALGELKVSSELCKIALSTNDEYLMDITIAGKRVKHRFTREWFEDASRSLLMETEASLESVMEENNLTWDDVDEILLVGGSSKIPSVQEFVRSISGKTVSVHDDMDVAVALGAATMAGMFAKAKRGVRAMDVMDVTSHSIGALCTDPGSNSFFNKIIIKRNSKIPAEGMTEFRIASNNMSKSLNVYILQGDSRDPTDCTVLDHKIISGFKNIGRGVIIEVYIGYDVNGMITVRATHDGEELIVSDGALNNDYSWMGGNVSDAPRDIDDVTDTNIMFCIDVSRSMEKDGALDRAKWNVNNFIQRVNTDNDSNRFHYGLIAFGDKAEYLCDFNKSAYEFYDKMKELKPSMFGRGTDCSPLSLARSELSSRIGTGIIVIVTDGKWGNTKQALKQAKECSDNMIPIFAIGLGNIDKTFLDAIANTDDGALYTKVSNLENAFSTIAEAINSGRIGLRSSDV